MGPQQLHLILNHIPIDGTLWTLILLGAAWFRPSKLLGQLALTFSFLLGLSVIAAYVTGGPAEEAVGHLPGVVEQAIEPHEDTARITLISGILLALTAAAALLGSLRRNPPRSHLLPVVVLVLVTGVLLGLTGHLGGKIHRPEMGNGPGASHPSVSV